MTWYYCPACDVEHNVPVCPYPKAPRVNASESDSASLARVIEDAEKLLTIIDRYRDGDSRKVFERSMQTSTPGDPKVCAAFGGLPFVARDLLAHFTALRSAVRAVEQEMRALIVVVDGYAFVDGPTAIALLDRLAASVQEQP